jgi:hypothetical protein
MRKFRKKPLVIEAMQCIFKKTYEEVNNEIQRLSKSHQRAAAVGR